MFNFHVILHYFMSPCPYSYIVIHPSLFRMTQKLSYSQTEITGITWFESGITSSSWLLWDLFNFLVIFHRFLDPNQTFYIAIHPGLIRMTQKLSYSQTGKLESPDLKVGYLRHPNLYEIYSTSSWFSATLCIYIQILRLWFIMFCLEWLRSYLITKLKKLESLDLKVG